MRLETYHSGSFSFACGAVGWQKSSGMAMNLLDDANSNDHTGQHLDDIQRPHDHEDQSTDREEPATQPHDVAGDVHISLQHAADHENPRQDDKDVAGVS